MAGLFMDESWKLGTADLIQQIGMLIWLNKGDSHKEMLQRMTQGRIMYELYDRLTPEKQTDQYQQECIFAIVDFIQKNPKASEAALVKEVTKQVEIFKQRVEAS